jgi:anti-anti-sigma factor
MNDSSRTPEGIPDRCPICGKEVDFGASDRADEAPSSGCGHLVWLTGSEAEEALMVRLPVGRRLDLSEEIDFAVSAIRRLRKEVLKGNVVSQLLLDFSDVAFISSKVLGQVITLDKVVKASGGRLKLCNVRPEIYELFRLTRLDRLFEIAEA